MQSFSNSPLVSYIKLSPNHSGQRNHDIDIITPHCVVGQLSVEELGDIFLPTEREASSNYGIGVDCRVAMYVEEKNRSWCSSSPENDHRAVTIECASDLEEPFAITMHGYICVLKEGNLVLSEHTDSKFVSIDELKEIDFAEADKPFISLLEHAL